MLFNAKWAVLQLFYDEKKLYINEMMIINAFH